ncbi:MAG: hypothetical protein IPI07_12185 [Flavobacteriales bacterium]|nr:hypothetical protein [Flavobacteriales bacterium]
MSRIFSFAILGVTVLLVACSGAKSYAKKGEKLDEAGLYAEAADMYLQALQRDQRNVEAKIGLKKAGQQVLSDKLGEFFRTLNADGEKGAAVEGYLAAKAYADKAARLGVGLAIPEHYRTDFERVKGEYLVELYTTGQKQLEKQEFKAAEATFARIAALEPSYKDATSLQNIAYLEPLYRAGKDHLASGQYRQAYEELSRVVTKDASFKDASTLRQEALSKGQYSIAVLPFTSTSKRTDLAAKLQAYSIAGLTGSGDPFVKVVDRENIERILEEQRLGLSGVVDEQTAVRMGNLMGAQAVLMGTVLDYREEPGKPRVSTKDGFETYQVRQKNPETGEFYVVTKYKPVRYIENYQENKVVASVSYKLVSLETGEVLMSKVVDATENDHIYYATYDGNKDALVPRGANGIADASDHGRRELRTLLNAPREMRSVGVLSSEVLRKAGETMANQVQQDLASKLP